MHNWVVDGFDKAAWRRMKKTVRRGSFIDGNDVFGEIECGALCFDLVLREPDFYGDNKWHLDADAFLLGLDTGYGYTPRDKVPYEYDGGVCLEIDLGMRYQDMLECFLKALDCHVFGNKQWSEYANKTDLTWEGVK